MPSIRHERTRIYATIGEDGCVEHCVIDSTWYRQRATRMELKVRNAAPNGDLPPEVDSLVALLHTALDYIDAMERTRSTTTRLHEMLLSMRMDTIMMVETAYLELRSWVYAGVR